MVQIVNAWRTGGKGMTNSAKTDERTKNRRYTQATWTCSWNWRFRSAIKERRSLRKSCRNTYCLAMQTPWKATVWTKNKHNQTECKCNETATWRNKRNTTWVFLEWKSSKMETASNEETAKLSQTQTEWEFYYCIHWFSLLQLVEICLWGHMCTLWLLFRTLFGSCFVHSLALVLIWCLAESDPVQLLNNY